MSTLAEYIAGAIQDRGFDVSYDSSIYRRERCDPFFKYQSEQVWMAYVYEAFSGDNEDITDDLMYKWIRQFNGTDFEITVGSLAQALDAGEFAWVGGATGADRFKNLFEGYSVAKFANAPAHGDGRYGYRGYDPIDQVELFEDACTFYDVNYTPQLPVSCPGVSVPAGTVGCSNVRILVPDYTLDSNHENVKTTRSGIYVDGDDTPDPADGDGSRDYIDVALYGTDYIVFRAGSYFQDGGDYELHFELKQDPSATPLASSREVRVSAIGYKTAAGVLQKQPDEIAMIEPVAVKGGDHEASLVITGFGKTVKSVVIATTLLETTPTHDESRAQLVNDDYFTYEYSYEVVNPSSANVTWGGNVIATSDVTVDSGRSLTIEAGTEILVMTDLAGEGSDIERVELVVNGDLSAVGTLLDGIVVAAQDASSRSAWTGLVVSSVASDATLEHVAIRNAKTGVKSYAPTSITHSEILDCESGLEIHANVDLSFSRIASCTDYGVSVHKDTLTTASDTLSACDMTGLYAFPSTGAVTAAVLGTGLVSQGNTVAGVHVVGSTASVELDQSEISGSFNGIVVSGDASLVITNSTIEQNATGVLAAGNVTKVTNITDCVLKDNSTTGVTISAANALVSSSTIDNCNVGVLCSAPSASTLVVDSEIRNSSLGLHVAGAGADATVLLNTFTNNTGGLKCENAGTASVFDNVFDGNGTAVSSISSGNPDLGRENPAPGQSEGNNTFKSNSTYHVANFSQGLTILAENNYWGKHGPQPTKFYGPVDRDPFLTQDPNLVAMMDPEIESEGPPHGHPKTYSLNSPRPNPFNPTTVVSYDVPPPGGWVAVDVFNVYGKLVRTLVDDIAPPGRHLVAWHGIDNGGGSVATGVYFVRMRAHQYTDTKKLVLLK